MATDINTQSTNVEDVLARIEKRERSKSRRKRIVVGAIAIAVLGGSVLGFNALTRGDRNLEVFAYDDISEDRLQAMLTSNVSGILVEHPDLGTETIRSMADYTRINEAIALAERYEALQNNSLGTDTANVLQPFVIDIAGERRAGEVLTFTIENFDPEIDYLLDLGNGQRRKVDVQTRYRYPRTGNFEVNLLASKGEASSLYTKHLTIERALPQEQEATTPTPEPTPQVEESVQIAEETDSDIPEEEVAALFETNNVDPSLFAAGEAEPMDFGPSQRRPAPTPTNPRGNEEEEAAPQRSATSATGVVAGPLLVSEVEPSYPGGARSMARFIQRNYEYPREARDAGIEGTVIIRFVVNADGSLSKFTLIKGIGGGCDEEAMRIARAMPNWVPGQQGGQNVAVYKSIPITFRLLN